MEKAIVLSAKCNTPVPVNTVNEPIYRKGYSPFINEESGTWWEYDEKTKCFFDTGVIAHGSDYVITESDYDAIAEKSSNLLQPKISDIEKTKLTQPATAQVGQIFKVKSINEDGSLVLQAVDMPSGGAKVYFGTKIPSETNDGDLFINTGTGTTRGEVYGVIDGKWVKLNQLFTASNYRGLYVMSNGMLSINQPNDSWIDDRNNGGDIQKTTAVTLNKLDYAVKAAMCDGKGGAWSSEEQAAARKRIGIGDYELIEEITLSDEVSEIIRDTDTLGNQYSMKNLLLHISSGATTIRMSMRIYINNQYIIDTQSIGDNTYGYQHVCKFDINNGRLHTFLNGNRGSDANRVAVYSSVIGMTKAIDTINSVKLQIANPIEGATIKIYGVRA